ncbi:MAG: hypothetical protein ABIP71_07745 [Verrucomicrobiota bacterium]
MNVMLFRLAGFCALLLSFSACKPKEINQLVDAGSALKTVFSLETAQVAGANKQVVMIVPNAMQGPASALGGEFKSALQKQGLSVVEMKAVDLGDPMRYNQFGWKAADFFAVLQKHSGVGAIVSLVGAPLLQPDDLGKIPATHPPVLVIATRQIGIALGVPTNPAVLEQMLNAKILQLAVIDGAGSSGKTDEAHKIFDQQFHILRSNP